jgi:hypothetical protein
VPAVQTRELQSPLTPQAAPSLQWGEQLGARHVLLMHTSDAQSAFTPQAAFGPHRCEHAGGAHRPFVQTRDPQSALAPQNVPWLQWPEQDGG